MSGQRSISTRFFSSEESPTFLSKNTYIDKKYYSYEVEFSKPHPLKPIPEGTVKVYFALIQMTNGDHAVEFNFENESLRHQLDNTMRTNMFEVYSKNWLILCRNGSTEFWKTSLR
jgi:hypothetical protein